MAQATTLFSVKAVLSDAAFAKSQTSLAVASTLKTREAA